MKTHARALGTALSRNLPWTVTSVEEKPFTQRPAPPFTTSTLQQDANRKFGFSTERTMQVAQRLFQGVDIGGGDLEGLISYHRTDSTTLSDKALREAGQAVSEMYGDDYYKGPRQYQTKVRNAQEAHEAIRPTEFRRTPQSLEPILESDELRIYDLIWKRAIASQMAEARMLRTTVEITGTGDQRRTGDPDGERQGDRVCRLPPRLCRRQRRSGGGARRAGNAAAEADASARRSIAPDNVDARLIVAGVDPKGHQTSPPPRYTEASLVKRLEEEGIGRPSTYAPTVATIQRRGYVSRQGKALVPSFTAFAVTRLLREHFGDYVDIGFTAEMEEILDQISNGEKDWLDFIREFYRGDGKHHGLEHLVEDKDQEIGYPVIDVCEDPETRSARCACASAATVRSCRWATPPQEGPRASLPDDLAPADLTCEKAIALLKAKAEGPRIARRGSGHGPERST